MNGPRPGRNPAHNGRDVRRPRERESSRSRSGSFPSRGTTSFARTSLSHDALSEFFAGNADGSYDFDTLRDLAAGEPARAVILFGSMENPDFVVSQQILGACVHDSWSPTRRLTLQVGARRGGTLNPGAIEHALPEGRRILDDLDNFSPRAGLVWSPDPGSVVRAAGGVFCARTPMLLRRARRPRSTRWSAATLRWNGSTATGWRA